MMKDIDFRKTEGLAMAVVRRKNCVGEEVWKACLLNLKEKPIENVIVNSSGYGRKDNRDVKTSELRQYFEIIDARSYVEIEILPEELLSINNQFWVSYTFEGHMYDRKYIFLAESIQSRYFTPIPLLNTHGVLIM